MGRGSQRGEDMWRSYSQLYFPDYGRNVNNAQFRFTTNSRNEGRIMLGITWGLDTEKAEGPHALQRCVERSCVMKCKNQM